MPKLRYLLRKIGSGLQGGGSLKIRVKGRISQHIPPVICSPSSITAGDRMDISPHRSFIRSSLCILLLTPLLIACPAAAPAQTGEWNPPGGTFARPRTLLTPNEVEPARERLQDPLYRDLYAAVWNAARSGTPGATGDVRNAMIAKNAAFVLLLDRKVEGSMITTPDESERAALRETILTVFSRIDPDVGTAVNYTDWQWKSKELIGYLCAYDLALGAGMTEGELQEGKEKMREFAGNLHRESTRSVLNLSFFTTVKNNHALMTAAALGMAAVVLNDAGSSDPDRQPRAWLHTALWNIDNLFWRDESRRLSQPGTIAGYAEGPHYLRYASLNLLPFFRSLAHVLPDGNIDVAFNGSSRSVRHPFHDPDYGRLWEWIVRIRRPDGLLPPIGDTYVTEGFPELAIAGEGEYFRPITSGRTSLANELNSTVDMRADFIAAGRGAPRPDPVPFQALPESGDLVFRSSWDDPDAIMFRVSAKNGMMREAAGGHNQADAGSFLMFTGQEMMALDPGYVSYDRREEVGGAAHHNMILVDGQGPEIGNPGSANGADAYIERTFDLPGLDCGVVRTGYRDADITRHFLFVDDYYVLIADIARSETEKRFTWQLHGNGRNAPDSIFGFFTSDSNAREAVWKRNGVAMTAHVLCDTPGYSYRENNDAVHEEGYDNTGYHTTAFIEATGTGRQFLAGLAPRELKNDLDIESKFGESGTTIISRITGKHTVFAQSKGNGEMKISAFEAALPSDIGTDAEVILLTVDPFSDAPPEQMLMLEGTSLSYGNRQYLFSSSPTDVALVRLEPGEYVGYCRDSAYVVVGIDENFTDVTGDGVRSWTMLWATGRVAIDLKSGGYFRITSTSAVEENRRDLAETEAALSVAVGKEKIAEFSITGTIRPGGTVRVYDITGRPVRSVPVREAGTYSVDMADLPPGAYFCLLHGPDGSTQGRARFLLRP